MDVTTKITSTTSASVSAFNGHVRIGSHGGYIKAATCTTGDGCHLFDVGKEHVQGASNGDVTLGGQIGVKGSFTFHAANFVTAVRGAYNDAKIYVEKKLRDDIVPDIKHN